MLANSDGVSYNGGMTHSLDPELQKALDASPGESIELIHPETRRYYVVVDRDTHDRAMEALREREKPCIDSRVVWSKWRRGRAVR